MGKKLLKSQAIGKNGKIWDKDSIKELILTNDKAMIKALLLIYKNQTETEKIDESTKELNGIGFNKFDAEPLTSLVKWYNRKHYLTPRQLNLGRKRMKKYSGQVIKMMRYD